MGVITFTDKHTSPILVGRIFKALIIDSHNLIPKLLPQVIKSIDIIQGNGGAGSIKEIKFEGDFELKEEEVKAGKEKVMGMYKVVEAYLLQNRDAYV
ncbi:hypothetical protein RJ640_011500 [Escallonia rubra]|uniref:Bet v I/Major latex protein domain-containing protein n=1 Tax=Escallonia rubra TaxID=112253 RepID=A0AA88RB14_9ASTE|nr:hypothetical protein RJ640_011500 [Escallonia rubra]